MHSLCKVRSENGYEFLRPGLKTGVENDIFWSEIGSGFGDAGGTPPTKNFKDYPPGSHPASRALSFFSQSSAAGKLKEALLAGCPGLYLITN